MRGACTGGGGGFWLLLGGAHSGGMASIWLIHPGGGRGAAALPGVVRDGACGSVRVPWLERPLGASALSVRAACLKGYYLDLTTAEGVNGELRAALSASRLPGAAGRDRAFLGHLAWPVPANPLVSVAPPRRHPRMLPDGAAAAMLGAVRTA